MFAIAVWYVWAAFLIPLEIELREGTDYLHVLAMKAGVDVYDHTKVAFVNMNHGPMDSVLKYWIATLLPRLEGHAVARMFVLLGPFSLLGCAYYVTRRWTEALVAAGALYLLLVEAAIMTIVGRADATVLVEGAVCCAVAHALLTTRHRHWTNPRAVILQMLLGALSAAMFLTIWRVVPTFGTLLAIVLARQVSETNYRFWPTVFASLGTFALGFAVVWVPMFVFELHGDWDLYYKHFFGFFTAASGWGVRGSPTMELFPRELFEPRTGVLAVMGVLTVAAVVRMRRERAQFIVWALILPFGWAVHSYGYALNAVGGGLHYFNPYFLVVWFVILRGLRGRFGVATGALGRLGDRIPWRPLTQLAVAGAFALFYPWKPIIARIKSMEELRAQSWQFRHEVAAITKGEPIFGENTQLYKRRYSGEVYDCGDIVDVFVKTNYFGAPFKAVVERFFGELEAHPPKFVMAGVFAREHLSDASAKRFQDLLRARYSVVAESPSTIFTCNYGRILLYERKK